MKVQGGAPGQVVDLDQAQEKRRAAAAKKLSQKYTELATEKVHASTSAPSPNREGEEETKQSLRRFMDWAASLANRRAKRSMISTKVAEAYCRHSSSSPTAESQKGQLLSRLA